MSGPPQEPSTVTPESASHPSFKDKVNAYSKEIAGKVFGKEHEVEQAKALHQGQPMPTADEAKDNLAKGDSVHTEALHQDGKTGPE